MECQGQEMVNAHTKSDNEPTKQDDYYSDVRLRPLSLSNVDDYMEWYTDEKVSKFCSWDSFKSKQEVFKYVEEVAIPHPWSRAICLKDDKPIGLILVTPNQGNDRCRAEIGFMLAYKYWGKGIVTKAVKMVAEAVFIEWTHLQRLEALVDVENFGSQKVLEKVGFTREEVLRKYWLLKGKVPPRDMVMFSLLSTDLNKHRKAEEI